jgi:hypothetical protein
MQLFRELIHNDCLAATLKLLSSGSLHCSMFYITYKLWLKVPYDTPHLILADIPETNQIKYLYRSAVIGCHQTVHFYVQHDLHVFSVV